MRESQHVLQGLIAGNHLLSFEEYYLYCQQHGIEIAIQPLIKEAIHSSSDQPIKCLHRLMKFRVTGEMIKTTRSYEVMKWLIHQEPFIHRDFHQIIERITLDDHLDDAIKLIYLAPDLNEYFRQLITMAATYGAYKIVEAFSEYVTSDVIVQAMINSIIKGHNYIAYHLGRYVQNVETYYKCSTIYRASDKIKAWLLKQIVNQ